MGNQGRKKVFREGDVFWCQRSMSDGTLLGGPVLAYVYAVYSGYPRCIFIHEDGIVTESLAVLEGDVIDKPVEHAEARARVSLAVNKFAEDLEEKFLPATSSTISVA